MKWFKFYGQDWMTDMKIINMASEDRLCFITLLCLASAADEGGLVRNCDEATLIRLTHLYEDPYETNNEVSRARGCLERYQALHCVTLAGNGDVTILNFDRRQGENLSNAEKQKNYRERLKSTTKSGNNRYVTQSNERYPRIDKNRIDKNRGEEREETPAQNSKKFFAKGDYYSLMKEIFTKGNNSIFVEKEMDKFILYWTEPNKSGTKVRWEQQPTFDVKRRLFTWFSRSKEFDSSKNSEVLVTKI